MANEQSILNAMKQVIQSGLNAYLPQSIEQIGERMSYSISRIQTRCP